MGLKKKLEMHDKFLVLCVYINFYIIYLCHHSVKKAWPDLLCVLLCARGAALTSHYLPVHAIITHSSALSKCTYCYWNKNSSFILYTCAFTQTPGVSVLSHKTLTSEVPKVGNSLLHSLWS